jgi:NAD(P)-dependent dehydrogenase (short-subunit alcohol dehydrogenase family)
MKNLNDLTVVITGASSGMGLAAAHAFARRGANVVLAARRRSLLDIAVRECDSLGGRALAVTADVTDPAQMRDLVRAAEREFNPRQSGEAYKVLSPNRCRAVGYVCPSICTFVEE